MLVSYHSVVWIAVQAVVDVSNGPVVDLEVFKIATYLSQIYFHRRQIAFKLYKVDLIPASVVEKEWVFDVF